MCELVCCAAETLCSGEDSCTSRDRLTDWAFDFQRAEERRSRSRDYIAIKPRQRNISSPRSYNGSLNATREDSVSKLDLEVGILESDMVPEMQHTAVCVMKKSILSSKIFREIAERCKREMDRAYGPSWQCVVGREYGIRVTHRCGEFLFCTVRGYGVLIYRAD